MFTLEYRREAFLQKLKRYTAPIERTKFREALDDFIAWSLERGDLIRPTTRGTQPEVIGFERINDQAVFWSAHVRSTDGAKLELLPRKKGTLPPALSDKARLLLKELAGGRVHEGSVLLISLRALKAPAKRERLKQLMDDILSTSSNAAIEGEAPEVIS